MYLTDEQNYTISLIHLKKKSSKAIENRLCQRQFQISHDHTLLFREQQAGHVCQSCTRQAREQLLTEMTVNIIYARMLNGSKEHAQH